MPQDAYGASRALASRLQRGRSRDPGLVRIPHQGGIQGRPRIRTLRIAGRPLSPAPKAGRDNPSHHGRAALGGLSEDWP